jgi:hypothetical protein
MLYEPEPTVDAAASSDEIGVLLTILRPEIVESAEEQLRAELYDDAIFAAYRRVEGAVQERTGRVGSIGDTLIEQALDDASTQCRDHL